MRSQVFSSQEGAVNIPLNHPYSIDTASFIGCGQTKRSYSLSRSDQWRSNKRKQRIYNTNRRYFLVEPLHFTEGTEALRKVCALHSDWVSEAEHQPCPFSKPRALLELLFRRSCSNYELERGSTFPEVLEMSHSTVLSDTAFSEMFSDTRKKCFLQKWNRQMVIVQ